MAALAADASAARRVAFVGFAAEGVSGDARDQFEILIEESLRKQGAQVVTHKDAMDTITARELPEGCAFGPCVAAVSKALGVDRILDARIAADGQSYSFVLSLIEGHAGTPVAQVVGNCAVCTVAEALNKVGSAVEVLEGRAASGEGQDLVAQKPRARSKAVPVAMTVAGAALAGGGAFLVSRDKDKLGWAAAGAGGALVFAGLLWLLSGD